MAGHEQLWTFFAEMSGGGLGSVASGNQHAMTAMNCFEPCGVSLFALFKNRAFAS